MNKETKKFIKTFQQYRRLQAKLVKLREKAPNPDNKEPMIKLLSNINGLLKEMDADAIKLLAGGGTVVIAKGVPVKKIIVN